MSELELKAILREEWCYLLGVQSPYPDQNFFSLGGDSLTAIELITRVADRTGWEIPVEVFFVDGTLGGLEGAMSGSSSEKNDSA